MKLKIYKEFEKDYSCRGIVLGSILLNCCGHINMKVLAIDYKSEAILIDGYSGFDLPTISQIKKRDNTYDIVYVKEAKGRECNLWISIDEIEKYNCEKKEEWTEVVEEKTYKDLPLYDSLDKELKEGDKVYNICLDNGEIELSTIVKDSCGELTNDKMGRRYKWIVVLNVEEC